MVVLKEMIFNSLNCRRVSWSLKKMIFNTFYFKRVWWSWKNWFVTVSTFSRVWWSWRNWCLTVSTFRGCCCPEITGFQQFQLWEGVKVLKELISNNFYFKKGMEVLKELIFNSFCFWRVWWSWKNSFLTLSTLGGCGGLKKIDF